ncbi:MAG: hypothetical protein QW327_03620 [Candidatus Odinarchaeota archaeon]
MSDVDCGFCSARSMALKELERYLVERHMLKRVFSTSPPKQWLCTIRFIRGGGGEYLPACIRTGVKPEEDLDKCIREVKPANILEADGVLYLF